MPLRVLYISFIFAFSMLGAIPAYIKLGGFSVSGLVTLSAIIIPLLFIKTTFFKTTFFLSFPFILFCLYDFLSFSWTLFSIDVFQNFSVWTGMLLLFLLSSYSDKYLTEQIIKILDRMIYIFIIILIYFIVISKDDPATMLVTLIFFSHYLSKLLTKQINNKELFIFAFLFIAPVITGSRIIYITEIVLSLIFLFLLYGNKKSLKDTLKKTYFIIISFIFIIVSSYLLESKIEKVMHGGDGVNVAGVSLNTSGRYFMWSVVYTSAQKNLVFGSGTDGPIEMLKEPKWQHPHNDYLRLLHHNGIIGLTLWLIFFINLMFFLIKRIKTSTDISYKRHYILNIILLSAIIIVMFTDNPIVYSYIMFPLMIISGASVALYLKEKLKKIQT